MGICIYDLIADEFSTLKRKKNPFFASYNMAIVLEISEALDHLCFIPLLEIPTQRQNNNHSLCKVPFLPVCKVYTNLDLNDRRFCH